MPQENDSEEELNEKEEEEEQIMVSQKEINEALNNIKPGKNFLHGCTQMLKKKMLTEYQKISMV